MQPRATRDSPASMLQLIPPRNTPIRSCALGRRLLRLSRPSLTWVQNARVRKEPWDLRSGSQTEVFPLARHVRSNLKSRLCQAAPPFPKSANSRRRCELIHIPDRPSCASFFFLRARSSGLLREQMATYSSTEARRKRSGIATTTSVRSSHEGSHKMQRPRADTVRMSG